MEKSSKNIARAAGRVAKPSSRTAKSPLQRASKTPRAKIGAKTTSADFPFAVSQTSRRRSWWRKYSTLVIIIVCLLALAGGAIFLITKYSNRATPGTNIAGINVAGQNEFAIHETINDLENAIKLTLIHDGKTVDANFTDLGINVDIDETTAQALGTSDDWLNRLNVFGQHNVRLIATVDWAQTTKFLNANFPELITDSRNAGVVYDRTSGRFVTQASATGKVIDMTKIKQIVEDLIVRPRAAVATVAVVENNPAISDAAAQAAADYANARLNLRINLNSEGKTVYYPDPPDIANWVVFTPDNDQLNVSFDEAEIKTFLATNVADSLSQKPVDALAIVGSDGQTVLRQVSDGRDGQTVGNVASLSGQIISALESDTPTNLDITLTPKPFSINKYIATDNRWIEANLSDWSVKLWDGSNLVWQTSRTSHGKPSTPTITGLFKVFSKVPEQCMPNPGPNGEPAPPLCHIRAVTYWGPGGYAFHEAWWLGPGNTNASISHGCINMYYNDAKTVYDFANIGTPVWVH